MEQSKLMTKYVYKVELTALGIETTVTRLSDKATKVFFNAGVTIVEGMECFMNSLTDTLVDTYFPKEKKNGGK